MRILLLSLTLLDHPFAHKVTLKNCSIISDNELFFHWISSLITVFPKPHEHVVQEFHRTTKQISEMLDWPPDRSPGLPQFFTSFEKIEWTNPPHVVLEG